MSARTHRVYLGIGSNVDSERNVAAGIRALHNEFENIRLSPAYRTQAVGFEGNDFINLVAACSTDMQPLELKGWLNALENGFGRARNVPKFSDRTLDIDILLYDDLRARLPGLELPRPEIMKFAHVLRPLADLAPDLIHPVSGKSIGEMWAGFADPPTMDVVQIDA